MQQRTYVFYRLDNNFNGMNKFRKKLWHNDLCEQVIVHLFIALHSFLMIVCWHN